MTDQRSVSTATATATSTMSKKRFNDISMMLNSLFENDEKYMEAIESIKRIMNFEPNARIYTPESGLKTRERAKRRAEKLGKSFYEISGQKSFYNKQKTISI